MEKFVTALGESFKEKNPNVTVESQFTGSSAGISSVLSGKADIGDSSRALTDEERARVLKRISLLLMVSQLQLTKIILLRM